MFHYLATGSEPSTTTTRLTHSAPSWRNFSGGCPCGRALKRRDRARLAYGGAPRRPVACAARGDRGRGVRGVDRSQGPGRRHPRCLAHKPLAQWAVEGVLLSSDLVPHLLAPLQLEDGAATAVCSRWAEG